METGAQVFISYAEENSAVALDIARSLRDLGYKTWTYEEDGVPGHSYLEQVHSAIHASDAFVLLASVESLQSHHVRKEVEAAYEQQKFVIPVRLNITQQALHSSPIFRMVSGTAVSIFADGKNERQIAEKIGAGLRKVGFQRDQSSVPTPAATTHEQPLLATAEPANRNATSAPEASSTFDRLAKLGARFRTLLHENRAQAILVMFIVGGVILMVQIPDVHMVFTGLAIALAGMVGLTILRFRR
jgi:hypothetical protein